MTRPLLLTAALGILAALACFTGAWAVGGFTWRHFMINFDSDRDFSGPAVFGGGPTITRTLPWSGGDTLSLSLPADVVFIQGPDAKVTVTGPQGAANAVEVSDGRIRLRQAINSVGRLKIVVTAPGVHAFNIMGSGDMRLEGIDQDAVAVKVFGSGDVRATGKARSLEVNIAGSGDADLGELAAGSADVHIAGSGDATVAAKERVDASIAGSGDVTLVTEPARVTSNVLGSGRVIHAGHAAPAPSAPAAPAPPVPSKPV